MISNQSCITECLECHRVCMGALTYCLRQGGAYAEASHVHLLLDCSQICQATADLMMRDSDVVCRICEIAAYVCERTAVSCEQWADCDPQMKQYTEVCRRCGECCRKIMIAA